MVTSVQSANIYLRKAVVVTTTSEAAKKTTYSNSLITCFRNCFVTVLHEDVGCTPKMACGSLLSFPPYADDDDVENSIDIAG